MDTRRQGKNDYLILPYFICSLASLFYVYDFIIRIIPGTIANELMVQYQIGAAGLGLLSSFFFLGYTLMQIPCGLLFDRFGPRLLLTITTAIAATSTFLFIATTSFAVASYARFFMGVGSAFAYIGALVLASRWLPKRYYAFIAGLIQLMGSIGAIIGEAPLAHLVDRFGAYSVITTLAIIGLLLALAFWFFVIDQPPNMTKDFKVKRINMWQALKSVTQNLQNWAAALYGFAIWAPMSVFASLWAVPFLSTLYNISTPHAASLASFLWVGIGLGGPIFGWLSNFIESRRIPLFIASIVGIVSSLIIIYVPNISQAVMIILLFLYGVAGSAQAVTFGVIQDNNSPHTVGTAAGFNNMAIVMGGIFLQPVVGLLLKYHHHEYEDVMKGIQTYVIADFRFALIVLPLCFVLSLLAVFLIRETHCENVTS